MARTCAWWRTVIEPRGWRLGAGRTACTGFFMSDFFVALAEHAFLQTAVAAALGRFHGEVAGSYDG